MDLYQWNPFTRFLSPYDMSTIYIDNPPTKYTDQLRSKLRKLPSGSISYVKNLFPIVQWLPKYNLIWFSGDITAAITIAILVIPQSLAYAEIANLPPVFGLYTSFLGVIIYPLFGTSKDVSIGVSAITSLMIGQILATFTTTPQFLSGEWTLVDASVTLSLFAGLIVLFLGTFQLGALFHFICQPAIAGFMAGSGLTVIANQFNKIFGIPGIDTSEAPYLVFVKTLIKLNRASVDAAFGISALLYLYGVKYLSQYLIRRYPQYGRAIFFFNSSRSIVVLVFGTLLCFMINCLGHFDNSPMNVIGVVPGGLKHVGVPSVKPDIVRLFISDLPGIVILLLMEHGAIATSLGKRTDYKVNMSQEMFANGMANVFGSFFCAYPGTGSFARSAVMSKSGARTPLASFFVGAIVLLSIYVLTPAFTYVPFAALSAIIVHSVTDLISGPSAWKKYWDKDPSELVVFASAYIIAIFTRIDIAVYVPVCLSVIFQLYRSARPKCAVLSQLDLQEQTLYFPSDQSTLEPYLQPVENNIICFQPQENITFHNASFIFEKLLDEIKQKTRCGKPAAEKMGDRPWNNTAGQDESEEKPLLQSVVLDLSGVHQMDFTGVQALVELAISTERYSGQFIHWYIVTGMSDAVRKSLLFAGFGNQRRDAKTPGCFISDLQNEVERRGHLPGFGPCCRFNGKIPVTTIERVEEKHSHHILHWNLGRKKKVQDQDSLNTLESGSVDKDEEIEKSDWCYCDIDHVTLNDPIVAVYDRFPFFFKSVSDAVNAALTRQRMIEDATSLDHISVVSDRNQSSVDIQVCS